MLAVVIAVVLAVMVIGSGVATLLEAPPVVANITAVGWPADRLWVLASVKVLGGIGLLVGIAVTAIGIAAAAGLVLYFVGALIAHVRVKNYEVAPAALSVAALVVLSVA